MVIATRFSLLDDQNLPFCSVHIMLMVTWRSIDQSHKSHNALHDLISPNAPFRTEYVHFCSEWCIGGYGTSALWDLWIWSIVAIYCASQKNKFKFKLFILSAAPNQGFGALMTQIWTWFMFHFRFGSVQSISFIFFRSSSLMLGQLYDCPEPVKQHWM